LKAFSNVFKFILLAKIHFIKIIKIKNLFLDEILLRFECNSEISTKQNLSYATDILILNS